MSIFGTIMSKVFGHADAPTSGGASAAPSAPAATQTSNTGAGASASAPPPVSSAPSPDTTGAASTSTGTPAAGGTPPSGGAVDVAAVLDGMESHAGQKLDWRHSIVDLMKLLDMDSSLSARKELAQELHYTGSSDDSAAMNIWLHKEVMTKFAANGGKLPSDLQH